MVGNDIMHCMMVILWILSASCYGSMMKDYNFEMEKHKQCILENSTVDVIRSRSTIDCLMKAGNNDIKPDERVFFDQTTKQCEIVSMLSLENCDRQDGRFWFSRIQETSVISYGKPVNASSVYHTSNSNLAVNGNDILFHSVNEKDPWIIIDLEQDFFIDGILFYNRRDVYGFRTYDLTVTIAGSQSDLDAADTRCSKYEGAMPMGLVAWMPCKEIMSGQYVKLQIFKPLVFFNFHLVEVFGSEWQNILRVDRS